MTIPTLASDTFTDTNGVNLTSHTMDKGTGWTAIEGATWTISSNKAIPPVSPAGFHVKMSTDVGTPNFTMSADIFYPNATFYFCPLIVRVVDKDNLWGVNIERDSGGTPYFQIFERVSGSNTTRANMNFLTTPTNTTITVYVECSGDQITAWTSTGEYLTYNSSLFNTATKVGIWSGSDASYSPLITVDNFTVNGVCSLYENLTGHWSFESNYTDALGLSTNTLTGQNTPTFNTGKIGTGLYLASASSQYASMSSNSNVTFGIGVKFAISAWVYFASAPGSGQPGIVSKWNVNGAQEYILYPDWSNNRMSFYLTENGDGTGHGTAYCFWGSGLSTGVWTHVMAWYTGVQVYLSVNNGTPVASTVQIPCTGAFAGTNEFDIGRQQQAPGMYIDGRVDEVSIWNGRYLTAAERTKIYNGGNGIKFQDFEPNVQKLAHNEISLSRY